MKKNKLLNTIVIVSLILQAFLFQIALPNMILCLGKDGHVAIELQNNTNTCTHENLSKNLIPFKVNDRDATDYCTDINLHFHASYSYIIKMPSQIASSKVVFTYSPIQNLTQDQRQNFYYINNKIQYPLPQKEEIQATILLI